ncbi:MAG: chromosome segregation protein SMC, partial [Clostridiales bacterium]|nr:chromosome segregation protein SMC [Clostridiales bacterium]
MNFNKIEMQGFKSFADRTEIEFDNEVTAIVGPNGCGKSNVADAVRWVLGEQSAKTLRGKSMQDVIFNGTENRKSTSYCEVSLFFDNKSRLFNIDFDELVLTRKLDRSGDSEYLINRNNCRLKDIIDLLRDTGAGREGYSIIGQGRIDEILSAKPDDRRNIFEEAAGIAKSKSKKLEAERKLMRTRDNLSRHEDIMGELYHRLEPLKKQSEDAQRYVELKDELKLNEVNAYVYQYENNNRERDEINKRIFEIDEKLAAAKNIYDQTVSEFNIRLTEIGGADEKIASFREELTAYLVEAEKNAGEFKLRNERLSNLKSEQSRFEAELTALLDDAHSKRLEIGEIDFRSEDLKNQIKNKNALLARAGKELNILKESLNEREGTIEQSNKSIIDNINRLSDIKANMSQLLKEEELLKEKDGELARKSEELRDMLVLCGETKQKIAAEAAIKKAEIDGGEAELLRLDKSYAEKQISLSGSREESKSLGQRIAALQTKVKMLDDIKNEYEGYSYPVKKLMLDSKSDTRLRDKNLGVLAEVIKVDEKYEHAIDAALGAALQNVIVNREEDAKFLIEYLKEKRYGRVTFLPLTSVRARLLEREYDGILKTAGCFGAASELIGYDPKFRDVIRNLLGRTVIVDTTDTAISMAKKYNYAFRIVTLEGDIFMTSGAISGGSRKNDSNADIISRDRNIAQTRAALKISVDKYGALERGLKATEVETDALKTATAKKQSQLKTDEIAYASLIERLEKATAQFNAYEVEKRGLFEQRKAVEARITEIR